MYHLLYLNDVRAKTQIIITKINTQIKGFRLGQTIQYFNILNSADPINLSWDP